MPVNPDSDITKICPAHMQGIWWIFIGPHSHKIPARIIVSYAVADIRFLCIFIKRRIGCRKHTPCHGHQMGHEGDVNRRSGLPGQYFVNLRVVAMGGNFIRPIRFIHFTEMGGQRNRPTSTAYS